ncbi:MULTISPECIES: hybrid sensor histidine kinase/response regulator [Burkholderia]|uniref:histidine kinase n=1 Tax=Burkholderia paludis TaxID=1506587 RepID=A0A6J5EYZ7_9BURK|nr:MULTISPECIES: ATP-binding protein [Burkholderia]CAB3770235.1 Sensor histidine kinase RcsC [Burkholderia paludis]VWB92161.1 GAF sensor hybrid histidine kinase [Burkholderia paludis]
MASTPRPTAGHASSDAPADHDGPFDLAADVIERWQRLVDLMADIVGVPAGLIMRHVGKDIQVVVASRNEANPFYQGESAELSGSGLYCEAVIDSDRSLVVPDARQSPQWRHNPDLRVNMVSYLGLPIHWPDRTTFGTICVLDCKENAYSERYIRLVEEFRDQIEMQLQLIDARRVAERERRRAAQLAENFRRQKDLATEASHVKSRFLAAASHDLRQPVHALSLFVGALRHVPMSPDGALLVERINQSVDAMDELFTAILDISRLDAGVVPVRRRPFAIGTVLERVCSDVAVDAHAKGLQLSYVRSSIVIDSDPVLLERIVRNLLSNAVRYTDAGRIVVGCRRTLTHVRVQVIDTGRGIPADQQSRVFDDYYQLTHHGRGHEQGMGLGLAIVRRLAELLDCPLMLRSEPGQGSCFELQVARMPSTVRPPTPVVDEIAVDAAAAAAHLVVVIDDESAIRTGMSILLAQWGYRVVATASASEAIAQLASDDIRPTLLICDLHLHSDENGIGAITRLRDEYNAAIPAMLITGDTMARRPGGAKHGGFMLLHKPVPSDKLRSAMERLLRAQTGKRTRQAGPG